MKIQVMRKIRIPSAKVMWRLRPLKTAFEHCYKAGSVVLNYLSYFSAYIKHLLEDTDFFQKVDFKGIKGVFFNHRQYFQS